ncbi:MAG: hypothetical protein Q7T20_03570, partial [Saprospiraceae bacterium]|nr:hypothetical protein [Saprospiraceae bacterium]
ALCLWAEEEGTDNPYIIIKNDPCPRDTCYRLDTTNVSTPEYSEYVAFPYKGQLYFSAYRFDFRKDKQNPKRNTVKLLKAEGADENLGQDRQMVVTDSVIFNDLKRQHTAHLSLNKAGDVAYFSVGDFVGDSADIRFELYRRKMVNDTSWGLPEKLPTVNMAGFTNTEPSVGLLPGDKFETLFFVSDRPDGNGIKDKNIWFSQIIGDSLTTPQPLEDLNTAGNEVTPFYHGPSNTLFFSTNGLQTLGGLDVYKSKRGKNGRWMSPVHMGAYINSSANDAYFVLDDQSKRGFFSSNRNGNTNYSEEGCCYDIFYVDFLIKYRALALNELTKQVLPYTRITLFEAGKDGQLSALSSPSPDISSNYAFEVNLDKSYTLIGEKEGFIPDTLQIKMPDELWKGEIVDTLYLRPRLRLIARVWDCETGAPVYGATARFYDLKKEGTVQTDQLPENANSTEYKIDFEQQYRVVMEKDGYEKPDTSKIVSTMGRLEGGILYVDLKLNRPDPFVDFVPITLYFDNDYPKRIRATDPSLVNATDPYLIEMREALLKNPRDPKYQDTVLLNYQNTFVDYARRYDTLFIPKYIQGERGATRINDSIKLRNFFENEVRANEARFREFAENLEIMLQQGDTIEIEIQGYASPLSNPEYNYHLTNRRTASVYNMFVNFDGGVFLYRPFPGRPGEFLGYYKPDNSGQLKFSRKPNGEAASKYKGKEAEDTKNPRTSIYDIRASQERRVEITGVKSLKTKCNPTETGQPTN